MYRLSGAEQLPHGVCTGEKRGGVMLVQCPYFSTVVYDIDEPLTLDFEELDSFVILIGLTERRPVSPTMRQRNCIPGR